MNERIVVGIIILILVVSIVQSFQINSLKDLIKTMGKSNGGGNGGGNGGIDMSGWTDNEKMMYEHHGTLPSRVQGGSRNSPSNEMVGGC